MRESLKNKQLRMQRIITTLYETYPDSKIGRAHV